MTKRFLLIITLLLSSAVFAQVTETEPARAANPETVTSPANNEVVTGGMLGSEDSAKFNEYRDVVDGVRIFSLKTLGYRPDSGFFFETSGTNLGGDDQFLSLRTGQYGTWRAAFELDSLPHRIASEAFSPYAYDGNGTFTVPGVVGILTTTADNVNFRAADMLENDRRIQSFLDQNLRRLPELGTDNDRMSLQLSYAPVAAFEARFGASRESREGQKITYGPLGDRPPRTMNVELPEPIDYTENSLQFDLAYAHRLFDVTFELFAPEFENNLDTMRWQSMYYGGDSNGAPDYNNDIILAGDAIVRRAVSTVGQRALPPDNRYTNATASIGANTPLNGRFTATLATGRLRQDETLLPYSYSTLTTDWNSTARLPRQTAEAEIDTLLADVQYVFVPTRGLRVRPFFRSYTLEYGTPEDHWYYVTQDSASNTTGGATFMNKRVNRPYDLARQNLGVEATWQHRSLNVGVTAEQEGLERDHRETDTDETIVRARASYRPLRWLRVSGRATLGRREGDGYDFQSESESYWYTPEENGTGTNNPRFSFTNHPDLRRFDVADRDRTELDLSVTATASPSLSFSGTYSTRLNDFDSNVRPIQPLAGTTFGAANDTTLGVQLGLLEQNTSRVSFDANWNPSEWFGGYAFVSLESIDIVQRSMGYNEDTRTRAQAALVGNPGQSWIDPKNLWDADHDDETTTFGLGLNYSIIPERLTLGADYTFSNGTVDVAYSGFGVDRPLETTYYAWRSPETAENTQHTANLNLEYHLQRGFVVGVRYLFDDYDIEDWMQEPEGGWVDVVSNYFVRDSTRDNRWGNRLPRLGGYLAPAYGAHIGFVTLGYRW